jgi:hypothetical protein
MRIIPGVVVCGLLVLGGTARADKVDPIAAGLTKLGTAAKCTDKASPWRPWCIATDFAKGTAAALPKKALVGMTVELEDGKDFADALSQKVTFVALAIDKDGKVKLTDVKPESPEETKSVGEAVFNAAAVFKGKATTAKLPAELSGYVKTLKGAYATKKEGGSWMWKGKSTSQLRKVGNFWVIIERPDAGNGIWATILTDAWE